MISAYYSSACLFRHGRTPATFAFLVLVFVAVPSAFSQVRRGPPEDTPALRARVANREARSTIADVVLTGQGNAADIARDLGRPGSGNPLGLSNDAEVAEAVIDIARRLKAGRERASAREFFAQAFAANERRLRASGRLTQEERLQILLLQARIQGLEMGDPTEAKPYLDQVTSTAPEDPRGHVLYDQLSIRYPELFPPVKRFPSGSQ